MKKIYILIAALGLSNAVLNAQNDSLVVETFVDTLVVDSLERMVFESTIEEKFVSWCNEVTITDSCVHNPVRRYP